MALASNVIPFISWALMEAARASAVRVLSLTIKVCANNAQQVAGSVPIPLTAALAVLVTFWIPLP